MSDKLRKILLLFSILVGGIIGYMFINFIGAISLGIFIYYSTRPVYDKLIEYEHINKTIAAFLAPLLFLIPVLFLIIYTFRIVTVEFRSLIIQTGDRFIDFMDEDTLQQLLDEELTEFLPTAQVIRQFNIVEMIELLRNIDADAFESTLEFSIQVLFYTLSSLSDLFFIFFIAFSLSFYLLRDGEIIKNKILSLISYDKDLTEYLNAVDKDLEIVFFGNILLAILTAALGVIVFTLLSYFFPGGHILAYPALIGILCGVTSLIPVIGMKLVYWPVTFVLLGIGWFESGFPTGLFFPISFFVIAFVIIDTIPDLIARPYIGSRGGISTGILLFSYILGPLTFGWYGLFFGPLVFIIAYEFVNIILPKIMKDI